VVKSLIQEDVDVLIVGGGLIGMALMCALVSAGHRVRLVEANQAADVSPTLLDTRSIALSPASVRILTALGFADVLERATEAIHHIHISEQGRFGQARLNSVDASDPLGQVVEMHVLEQALKASLNKADVCAPARVTALDASTGVVTCETQTGPQTFCAKWVIAADGAHSSIRKMCGAQAHYKYYSEHAIATNVALSRSHHNIAYERFTTDGPLALLPLKGPHMALVWTLSPEHAARLNVSDDAFFLQALQRAFGYRVGRFTAVGQRMTYPLCHVMMPQQVDRRVIFVGNAAHTLHPVAGQGFNLGLRDVAMLAECAINNGLTDEALEQYQKLRKSDQSMIVTATDGLVSLFKSKFLGVGLARRMGLVALDNSAFLKGVLLRHAKGFGGVASDLVCGFERKHVDG
jgi:2-octaprenyl-6-methoxyphenol hydroxylase